MYNIDQEVYVKGTIVGVNKNRDGKFEYEVEFKDELWGDRRISVTDGLIRTVVVNPITMDELEKRCQ